MRRKARATCSGLAAAAMATLMIAASAAPASADIKAERTSVTITSFTHEQPVQTLKAPRRFKVPSADSYVIFSGLHWRGWGGKRAVARGKATTCEVSCTSHATKLIADQRHGCFGEYWNYGRLTATVIPLYGTGPFEIPVELAPCEKPLQPGQE